METDEPNGGLDGQQLEEVVGLALAAHHLPALIDTLSNVPGGGMRPSVASRHVIPSITQLLLLQATTRRGVGSMWRRTDAEDRVDHAFLLSKKALFSADVGRRSAAVGLLVGLLGVAAAASGGSSGGRNKRSSTWTSMMYDMKGCLRRSLTQHQVSKTRRPRKHCSS